MIKLKSLLKEEKTERVTIEFFVYTDEDFPYSDYWDNEVEEAVKDIGGKIINQRHKEDRRWGGVDVTFVVEIPSDKKDVMTKKLKAGIHNASVR